jgi:hypothetical protein
MPPRLQDFSGHALVVPEQNESCFGLPGSQGNACDKQLVSCARINSQQGSGASSFSKYVALSASQGSLGPALTDEAH